MTFNHGVEGSSPSALTIEINYLSSFFRRASPLRNKPRVHTVAMVALVVIRAVVSISAKVNKLGIGID